jgi:hypothetical protein
LKFLVTELIKGNPDTLSTTDDREDFSFVDDDGVFAGRGAHPFQV